MSSSGLRVRSDDEGAKANEPPAQPLDLERAFVEHRSELLGYARLRLRDPEMAQEALQETFVRALRSRLAFQPSRGNVRGWIFGIERRVVADLARAAAQAAPAVAAADPAQGDGPEAWAQAQDVERGLRRLSGEHLQVILEIYYRGTAPSELAARLGLPPGTVRSRLYYALRHLRQILEEAGWQR